ncbi:thiol:disulfide interchange protein DsbA/DsbL [Chromatiaceae bacterium AAb-1]|nr:thiol:disulfide interchange protein DsbA/DsbL [Chromatiaceae bacterium AAb-1]
MKKFLPVLLAVLLFPLAACADKFEQGKHYDVIAEEPTAKPEVKEFFSFYCGGCYAFEPIVQRLAQDLPAGTEFKKVHVDFIRAASPELQNALARTYLVAKNMGKGDQISTAIFNQIHRNRAPFTNEADIRNLVMIYDIDGAEYDKAMRSFSVMGAVRQMKKEQDELAEKRVLTGVPTLVVNGKYKINNANLNQRNIDKELGELVNYLLSKDAGE